MANPQHRKKMIAPIVIIVLVVLYIIGYSFGCLYLFELQLWMKLVGAVVPLAICGVAIATLIQRIKEIRSGEEDDLSQY